MSKICWVLPTTLIADVGSCWNTVDSFIKACTALVFSKKCFTHSVMFSPANIYAYFCCSVRFKIASETFSHTAATWQSWTTHVPTMIDTIIILLTGHSTWWLGRWICITELTCFAYAKQKTSQINYKCKQWFTSQKQIGESCIKSSFLINVPFAWNWCVLFMTEAIIIEAKIHST